jgi:quercetin dioxygenase-like cupin family protein
LSGKSAYVLEGGFELPIQGQETRTIKAGDAFQIPPETPHAGGKAGTAKSRILITYVVQKGKPSHLPRNQNRERVFRSRGRIPASTN